MALRARSLVSCVVARAAARGAVAPAFGRRVCGAHHHNVTAARPLFARSAQGAVWRAASTAATEASIGDDADAEPVDYTELIPDNLHLHNPQDALPKPERASPPCAAY